MPRMHPQLRPIMQAPAAGTTGKAPPPPVAPPGSAAGTGVSLDKALLAVVAVTEVLAGAGAPFCVKTPTPAPHPAMKTNKPTPTRNATGVLLLFTTTPNSRFST
jgi:hypothetical protein